jgi:ABC-type lipopolysaccharide export system ATPase subunit
MYRGSAAVTTSALQDLIDRIGAEHVERRLKVEIEHEAQVFGQGLIFFNLENWYSAPWIVRITLKLVGLYSRARRNADQIVIRRSILQFAKLPPAFEGFTILHLSDLHADISEGAMRHLVGIVRDLQYELTLRLSLDAHLLSGGQKQMVAIGQALIARPRYLLIDELSFGLAPAVVVRLGETIRAIVGRGIGVLLIEQFTTLALALASRAYVMERGRVVFSGTSDALRNRPEVLHGAYLAGRADVPEPSA